MYKESEKGVTIPSYIKLILEAISSVGKIGDVLLDELCLEYGDREGSDMYFESKIPKMVDEFKRGLLLEISEGLETSLREL